MRSARTIGLTVAALLAATPAHAALTILKDDGTEALPEEATMVLDPATGGWTVTLLALYAPGDFTIYNIHGDAGEVIDDLVVAVPGAAGSPVIVHVVSDTSLGISTLHQVRKTGTAETILSTVNVRKDIGSVDVDEVGILNAGRDVIGPVHARIAEPLRGINMIEAQGDILGDVTADGGRIIFILSYGRLGTPEAPVTVRAKHGIIQIGSYGGIWGDVNTRFDGGAGRTFAFGATAFEGTLETEGLMSNPFNGWPGRINILDHFDASITIGTSLDDPEQWIELPPTGFAGQIVINADDEPFGTWTSPVYLGPPEDPEVVLIGPYYPHTAESLGGGSIGLAPFALHESSCVPAYGGVVSGGPSAVVALRHYGPVHAKGTEPTTIERRPLGSNGAWSDVPASGFVASVAAGDANTLELTAAAGAPGFEPGYEYRIHPTGDLVSDIPARSPVAWSRGYIVAVDGASCPSDVDGDGIVGFADILDILSAWGACKACPEDLDGDGIVGFADVLAILRDWGPCP